MGLKKNDVIQKASKFALTIFDVSAKKAEKEARRLEKEINYSSVSNDELKKGLLEDEEPQMRPKAPGRG